MASIRKKPNGKWEAQIRRKGFAPISKTFHMRTDALEWARYMEQKADRRDLPYDSKQLDTLTLRCILERYRDQVVPKKRGGAETHLIDAFLKQETKLCSLPLSCVGPSHFSTYRDKRSKQVKPASICRVLSIIQHAYNVALTEWAVPLQENPVSKIKKPEVNDRRERRLTGKELKALLHALSRCENPYIRPMTLFALETGMRRGELLAADWKHFNLNSRTLHLPLTKNGDSRTVPLTDKAVRLLRLISRSGIPAKGRIFDTSEQGFTMAWRRAIIRSGIADLRFHDLRHEAISRFFERGLSMPEVALISGHKDFRMLFRYTHLKAEDVAAKLNPSPTKEKAP